jgi:hypothetical protein
MQKDPLPMLTTYNSPDGLFTLQIPEGWEVSQTQKGVDHFVVFNPAVAETYVWKWPATLYLDPDNPSAQFLPAGQQPLCKPMRAEDYLTRVVLPEIRKMSGIVEVVSRGLVSNSGMVYCDYDRPGDGRMLRGRAITTTKIEGNGAWIGVAGGFEAPREQFESMEQLLQNILYSYKVGTAVITQQQEADKRLRDLHTKNEREIQGMIQGVITKRQAAMDDMWEKWNRG